MSDAGSLWIVLPAGQEHSLRARTDCAPLGAKGHVRSPPGQACG